MADELLSCPFCGGAAEVREWDFPYVRFQARCVECKTTGRTRFNERAKAIAAWNHRTPPTPATEEREAVARAEQAERSGVIIALWAEYRAQSSEKLPVTIDDAHSRHRYLVSAFADAALSALREARAAEILAAERERDALREALLNALASLVAATSLLERGGKKAAPSDKMFAQMLVDYNKSAAAARAALTANHSEHGEGK